ncbi:endonuclease [Mangrovimonas sp. ST2L15]|uniref:endonuclease n=1 Tax=Mangrovimonas sp. ST2L15 TaxID=1645916 RepID=UPI0006B412EC|nr:endonuclease [Mangrovimonas sp. ST2L15]
MFQKLFLIGFMFLMVTGFSQIPTYYQDIDFTESPSSIKTQLSDLITTTHTTEIPYTSSETDTWDAVKLTDEVPENMNQVFLIYGFDNNDGDFETDYTRDKDLSCHTSNCSGLWTREHVFARSLAIPSLTTDQPGPGTDVHNLRACDGNMNSTRSNRLFQDSSGDSHITTSGEWYPGDEWKGDVARIIMYMYLRYPTQCLPNNTGYGNNMYHPDMPDVFLDWNEQDPVSEVELQRNDVLEDMQGNRNPFIDNPYLATMIWNGPDAEDTWNLMSIEEEQIEKIKIYPNPVVTKLYISNNTNAQFQHSIYSQSGKKIALPLLNNVINVESLVNGFYILKLLSGEKVIYYKFIKN